MVTPVLLWAILAPALLAGVVLLLGIAPWNKRPASEVGDGPAAKSSERPAGGWAAGLAIALGYSVGQWGQIGWQPLGGDITQWLIYFALAGAAVGVLEARFSLPALLRLLVRFALSGAAAWLLLRPLLAQSLNSSWVIALAAAFVLVWTVLDVLAAAERGPLWALLAAVLAAGVSATVLFANNASTAMLTGALISTLGAAFVVTAKFPAAGRLRSATPVVALVLVGQLAIGRFYGEGMPPSSFLLLLAAPLLLLLVQMLLLRRAGGWLRLLVRVGALTALVALAAGLAAATYFAPPAAKSGPTSNGAAGATSAPAGKTPAGKSAQQWDGDYGYD